MNTPYQRIVRAAKEGKGVRLTPDEVFNLSFDDAISTRAELDDANDKGISDDEIYAGEKAAQRQA